MKLPFCLRVTAIALLLAVRAVAQQPPPALASTPAPKKEPRSNIRVEAFAVFMPQEKALAMLPQLLSEVKIDEAFAKIMEGVQNKEFALAAYQTVLTTNDETGTAETINERIYPTQYDPPQDPQHPAGAATPAATPADGILAVPTAFEKRNVGVTLEVQDARVIADGRRISASVWVQDVSVIKWDTYDVTKTASGKLVKVQQPRFFVTKSMAAATFPNGHFVLVGLHKLDKPAGSMEVHLVRITATPREL